MVLTETTSGWARLTFAQAVPKYARLYITRSNRNMALLINEKFAGYKATNNLNSHVTFFYGKHSFP